MGIGFYLQFPFAQHALEAAFLVAVSCGLIGPFVITRTMSFAVHGTSELAFTGAVAGLLVADNPLAGALVGALVVASLIGLRHEVNFEGQAAIELETIAEEEFAERYEYGIDGGGPWQVDFRPTVKSIVSEVAAGVPRGRMAAKDARQASRVRTSACSPST